MIKGPVLCFLLFCFYWGFSQNRTTRHSNLQLDVIYGTPIEHDKSLDDAVQGNSYGFLLSWNKVSSKKNTFNTLYNFPERGYTFLYNNFNSTILGEVYGAYRHFTYNLTPKRKNHLKFTSGFGLGYATKKFDAQTNDLNFAIGSKLLVSAYLKLQYFQLFNQNRLKFNTGISLVHFSNISFKNPNLGINVASLNFGLNYDLDPIEIQTTEKLENVDDIDKSIHFNLVLRGGYNQSLVVDSDLYPFYTITFYGSKKINNYSTVTAGIDYFNAKFLKNYIRGENLENETNHSVNDYKRVGVFLGHELVQNHFSFISQVGYTIYYPYPYISRIYERFGFKYTLGQHLFTEITMKVNLFRAEALEFGIGYQF